MAYDKARLEAYAKQQGIPIDGSPPKPIRCLADIPDIMTMNIPPIDFLVDGLVSRGSLTLWTGADGVAKSLLALRMGLEVARGGIFLGRQCQQANVLFLDYENPSFEIRRRLDVMLPDAIEGLPNFRAWGTWCEQQPPQIIESEVAVLIAKESQPLIIVDPLRYAHSAEENDSGEMSTVMQAMRSWAIQGAAVVILHHPAKQEGSTGRGSTAIRGAVDVAFLQEISDETQLITLRCVKNRFGERFAVTVRPDFEAGTFEVTDSPKFVQRREDLEKLKQIIAGKPGINQNEICAAGGGMKARVSRLLKEGVGTHWETQPGPNRAVLYFPVGTSPKWFAESRTTSRATEPQGEAVASGSGGSPLKGREPPNHPPPTAQGIENHPRTTTEKLCSKHGFHADWFPDGRGVQVCGKCNPTEKIQ